MVFKLDTLVVEMEFEFIMMRTCLSETDISHFAMTCDQKKLNLKDNPPDVFPLSAPGINTLTI